MEATDLRIGNLIMDDNKVKVIQTLFGAGNLYVDYVDSLSTIDTSHNALYKDIEPIKLTEEWLEKFGFTSEVFDYDEMQECHIELWEEYDLLWNSEQGLYLQCDDVSYNKDLTHIKYVHQLQNLYFALTGQELTIKELV